MSKLSILAAVFVFAAGSTAAAEEPAAEASATAEKKVCKTEKMTGSLTRVRRTCLTQREWDRLAEVSRKGVDNIIRDANTGDRGGTGG